MESRLERQNVDRHGFDQVSWKIDDGWLLSKKLDPMSCVEGYSHTQENDPV
jgi:hypothetical protein